MRRRKSYSIRLNRKKRHKILIESVASSKKAVDDSLFKHLQIRNLIMRNQQNDLTEEQKIPLPFFLITCPTNKSDLMIDVDHDGLSAVVSFTHNTVVCNGVVYKSTDILQHMKLDDKVG
ncbi:hypothetical protein BDB01DRAFT_253001 [Pilobolus umbonatus]|nr:hypothetical protein BDB01DRAFT_253001 [Pilobolus umbonatus]